MKRKLYSLALAAVMMAATAVPAFAANVTISGEHGAGVQFSAYQLMTLTTSLASPTCHTGDNPAHTADCWNYAYQVNPTYQTALQNVVGADADLEANGGDGSGTADDTEIINYIGSLTADADVRLLADNLFAQVKDMTADAQTQSGSGEFTGLAQGYYLIIQNSVDDAGTSAKSLAMLNTAGQMDITIEPKTSVPVITKEVYELNDSTQVGRWGQSADYDYAENDEIEFRIASTVPDNITSFDHYSHIICDEIDPSLDIDYGSISVKAWGKELLLGTDYTIRKATDETLTDTGTDFEIYIHDLYAVATRLNETVAASTSITVEYSAYFNNQVKYGSAGQYNYVHLRYTNDPYWDGTGDSPTSKTEKVKVGVYTYVMRVDKTDTDGNYLTGAEFKLLKFDHALNTYTDYLTGVKNDAAIDTGDSTIPVGARFTFAGLDAGLYQLTETTVPDGYNEIEPIYFEVRTALEQEDSSADYQGPAVTTLTIHDKDGNLLSDSSDPDAVFAVTLNEGLVATTIENASGLRLPSTGGMGTYLIYGVGAVLLAGGISAVVIMTKKKNQDTAEK